MGKSLRNFFLDCKYPHFQSLIFSLVSLIFIIIVIVLLLKSKKKRKLSFLSIIILILSISTFLIPFSVSINGIYNDRLFFGNDKYHDSNSDNSNSDDSSSDDDSSSEYISNACKLQGFIVIFSQICTDIWVLFLIYYQYLIYIKRKKFSIKKNRNNLIILGVVGFAFPLIFSIYFLLQNQYKVSEYNYCFLRFEWEGDNDINEKASIYIFASIHIITFILQLFYIIAIILFYNKKLKKINDKVKVIRTFLQLLAFPSLYILGLFFYTINNIHYFFNKEPNFIIVKIGNFFINICSIIIPIVIVISFGLIKKNKYLTIENFDNSSKTTVEETITNENLSELIKK